MQSPGRTRLSRTKAVLSSEDIVLGIGPVKFAPIQTRTEGMFVKPDDVFWLCNAAFEVWLSRPPRKPEA